MLSVDQVHLVEEEAESEITSGRTEEEKRSLEPSDPGMNLCNGKVLWGF